MSDSESQIRYFTSYSGVSLPLKMVGEITREDMENRNTYFEASYDPEGKLRHCRKLVYGEVDLEHIYHYNGNGTLSMAEISNEGDDFQQLQFDESGKRLN